MNSLYIHIPFCEKKCFYCSFVVSVGQIHAIDTYLDCLESEAQKYHGMDIETIYIGGGTPTLMDNRQLLKLFDIAHKHFNFSSNVEWTIEANPQRLHSSKLKLIKEGGVNRISLGVQSLSDKYLKYLGRNHDSQAARKSFDQIRKCGFDNINVDLMFSFPQQTMEELKGDVDAVAQLGSEHISLYALTVEKHSKFYAQNIQLQDGHDQGRQYTFICEALEKKGFRQYEVSNFSKPAKVSKHNLNYWQGGHYVGLGIGAHSYIGTTRSWNVSRLNEYISCIEKGISTEDAHEELTSYMQMKEAVLFGLRMNGGIDTQEIKKRFGCFFCEDQQKKIDYFVETGFLDRNHNCLRTSPKGRLVLDELCAALI